MMMMKRKRKRPLLSERGSNQILRPQLEAKEDPLLKMIRLKKPQRNWRNRNLLLKEPQRRIKGRETKGERRRRMKILCQRVPL
jgi:hypothetical protein